MLRVDSGEGQRVRVQGSRLARASLSFFVPRSPFSVFSPSVTGCARTWPRPDRPRRDPATAALRSSRARLASARAAAAPPRPLSLPRLPSPPPRPLALLPLLPASPWATMAILTCVRISRARPAAPRRRTAPRCSSSNWCVPPPRFRFLFLGVALLGFRFGRLYIAGRSVAVRFHFSVMAFFVSESFIRALSVMSCEIASLTGFFCSPKSCL